MKSTTKDDKLKHLFKIFTTVNYKNEDIFPKLSKRKEEIINLDIGGANMSGLTLDIFKDGRKLGREEGREEGMIAAFAKMIKKGLISIKDAAKDLDMTEEELKKLMLA